MKEERETEGVWMIDWKSDIYTYALIVKVWEREALWKRKKERVSELVIMKVGMGGGGEDEEEVTMYPALKIMILKSIFLFCTLLFKSSNASWMNAISLSTLFINICRNRLKN